MRAEGSCTPVKLLKTHTVPAVNSIFDPEQFEPATSSGRESCCKHSVWVPIACGSGNGRLAVAAACQRSTKQMVLEAAEAEVAYSIHISEIQRPSSLIGARLQYNTARCRIDKHEACTARWIGTTPDNIVIKTVVQWLQRLWNVNCKA